MNPNQIIFSINIALFAAIGLFFTFVLERPELIPLFTGFQAAFNLLGMIGFYLDKKKKIMLAFLWGFLLTAAVTVAGFMLVDEFQYLVGVDEG